jgi:hypothetical protein
MGVSVGGVEEGRWQRERRRKSVRRVAPAGTLGGRRLQIGERAVKGLPAGSTDGTGRAQGVARGSTYLRDRAVKWKRRKRVAMGGQRGVVKVLLCSVARRVE